MFANSEDENRSLVTILVNYNGINDTIECIKELKKSSVHTDIIVVDNGSDNNEADIIREIYPKVVAMRSEENLGFSGGNNIGIQYALKNNYDYICLLNNDTIVDKKMLEYLVSHASDENISVPIMYYFSDKRRIWYAGGKVNRWTGNSEHFHMNDVIDTINNQKCTFATGCCMMIKNTVFEKIGLLNELYFMYCEDTDFSLRCIENNISIELIVDAKLWHKVGQSTGGEASPFSIYYMTRNRFLYIKEYTDYFHLTAFPYTLITRYIRMLQLRLQGKQGWKAFKRAIDDARKNVVGKVKLNFCD